MADITVPAASADPCPLDLVDALTAKSEQLRVLLATLADEEADQVLHAHEGRRRTLTWLARDLAGEVLGLVCKLTVPTR